MLDNNSVNFNDQLRDTQTYYASLQLRPNDSMVASITSLYAKFKGDSISGSFASAGPSSSSTRRLSTMR